MKYNFSSLDGHSDLELPVPISNTEVKQVDVPGCTVMKRETRVAVHLFFSKTSFNITFCAVELLASAVLRVNRGQLRSSPFFDKFFKIFVIILENGVCQRECWCYVGFFC